MSMKLYNVAFCIFRKPGELETNIPAFSPTLAANKLTKLVAEGKLVIGGQYTQRNKNTDQEETVNYRERINGMVQQVEVGEMVNPAFHRRVWDEQAGKFRFPAPSYDGRSLINSLKMPGIVRATVYNDGYQAARKAFSPRAKLAAQLKKALKSVTVHPEEFAAAFSTAWNRLAARALIAKSKKPARKPRKLAAAACLSN